MSGAEFHLISRMEGHVLVFRSRPSPRLTSTLRIRPRFKTRVKYRASCGVEISKGVVQEIWVCTLTSTAAFIKMKLSRFRYHINIFDAERRSRQWQVSYRRCIAVSDATAPPWTDFLTPEVIKRTGEERWSSYLVEGSDQSCNITSA